MVRRTRTNISLPSIAIGISRMRLHMSALVLSSRADLVGVSKL